MKLIELGLGPWFKDRAGELCEPGQCLARVTVVNRGQYIIRNEFGELSAEATGKFMHDMESKSDMPCVGDWVCAQYHNGNSPASIHSMLPRKSFLRRKAAGKGVYFQMIAANIDTAFIVQSCHLDFNVSRLERYLVMANEGNVEPLIILTKTDLVSAEELEVLISEIRDMGIHTRVIPISNISGDGLDEIRECMAPGKTYCVVGSSGVGKSTLINRLIGHDALKTGVLSNSGEGRHTTVRRQLFVLEAGAMLIDTPGMREVGILHASEGLDENFDDIEDLSLSCHFSNCSHTSEPRCAILKAIDGGTILRQHYEDYLKLKKESLSNEKSYTVKHGKGRH